ncbi:hypothetical protein EJB05_17780, partial [Eragrostis curvula]
MDLFPVSSCGGADACFDSVGRRSRPGDELAELLWDNGPALRRTPHFPPPFQPFTCSAAGSSRAHELSKRHAAAVPMDDDVGLPVHHHDEDDDAVPWLHCPVIDDGDSDTAPLPPEYCAGLLSGYSGLHAVPVPPTSGIEQRPSSNGAVVVPTARAVPTETAAAALPQPSAGGGEGVVNFTFFSRPLQRPQVSAAPPSNPVEPTVMQKAASRLRSTPLFSEQRMAWLQPPPPKAPRATAAAPTSATEHHRHAEAAAKVTQHRLQPNPRAPDATAAVTTSSVCSGNGDRTQARRSSHQTTAECSDGDDEGGAMRRSAARGTKRTRPAEVHNLSERRRRDRINEKMRALQELIPNCNKIDKASMLEEAIEYLKTLQLQVQMMSMGPGLCVPPMLLPAMQHMQMPHMPHFPHLGMGLGFGMGAAAFDMLPRLAGTQFPCPMMPGAPPMAMPPGSMFGLPGQATFPHFSGFAPAEQMQAAAPASGGAAGAGDHPPVPVTTQGEQKLQHPKQT